MSCFRLKHNSQAGEELILEDGFDSGTDFIAEIKDCVPDVEIISFKGLWR